MEDSGLFLFSVKSDCCHFKAFWIAFFQGVLPAVYPLFAAAAAATYLLKVFQSCEDVFFSKIVHIPKLYIKDRLLHC